MLQRATLGGIAGVVDLGFRMHSGIDGEWKGTFFFQSGDEPLVSRMLDDRPAILETTLEEEHRTLPVMITSAGSGIAFFRSEAWLVRRTTESAVVSRPRAEPTRPTAATRRPS